MSMKRHETYTPHGPRRKLLSLLLFFSFLLEPSIQFATRQQPARTTDAVVPIEYSDTSLLVGNLPWDIASDVCRQRIERLLYLESNEEQVVTIEMKPVDTTRPRDRDKCHGGSAQVTFGSHDDAVRGMVSLKKDVELRVRWAIKIPSTSVVDQKPTLLDEKTIQHRKERAARYARKRQRVATTTDAIITRIQQTTAITNDSFLCSTIGAPLPVLEAPLLDWSEAPKEIDPMRGGGLSATGRGERKRATVEAFVHVVRNALLSPNNKSGQTIADLGSGAGNLSLPLTWWLHHYQHACCILGVDLNERSLQRLDDRAAAIGLNDKVIETKQLDMLNLLRDQCSSPTLSAVVSLHACGAATDLAVAIAVRRQVPFVVSPCCIGKVNRNRKVDTLMSMPASAERSAAPNEISYPRSDWLKGIVNCDEYSLLAAAADYAGSLTRSDAPESIRRQRSRQAKQVVELDRLQWAKERGYMVRLMELPRIGPLYSKRELLLGAPSQSETADRISMLDVL